MLRPYIDQGREFYRNGTSIERILKRYPQLGPAKVFDALAFALDNQEVVDADLAHEESLLATRVLVGRTPDEVSRLLGGDVARDEAVYPLRRCGFQNAWWVLLVQFEKGRVARVTREIAWLD